MNSYVLCTDKYIYNLIGIIKNQCSYVHEYERLCITSGSRIVVFDSGVGIADIFLLRVVAGWSSAGNGNCGGIYLSTSITIHYFLLFSWWQKS